MSCLTEFRSIAGKRRRDHIDSGRAMDQNGRYTISHHLCRNLSARVKGDEVMERRDFLKESAMSVAAFSLTGGDLASAAEAQTARVALVRTRDRAAGVAGVMKLLDAPSPKGRSVLIKPNLFLATARPNGTHNDTLRQVVQEMKARGASRITVGDRSGPSSTKTIMELKGLPAMGQELGFQLLNFEELPANGWVHFDPRANHWQKGFDVARPVVEAEHLVWVCCLKAHTEAVFAMSLKHGIGAVHRDLMAELHGAADSDMRVMIAETNQAFRPHVIVMDGVEVFVDGGPARGTLVAAGVVLAGTDRVAVDAVGLAILKHLGSTEEIMSKRVFEQEQMRRAVELGLGVGKPDQIEIVTGDAESREYADAIRRILARG
jgi:uncharacterized protein (DUF362 family)